MWPCTYCLCKVMLRGRCHFVLPCAFRGWTDSCCGPDQPMFFVIELCSACLWLHRQHTTELARIWLHWFVKLRSALGWKEMHKYIILINNLTQIIKISMGFCTRTPCYLECIHKSLYKNPSCAWSRVTWEFKSKWESATKCPVICWFLQSPWCIHLLTPYILFPESLLSLHLESEK